MEDNNNKQSPEQGRRSEDDVKLHLTSDSTLQTREEKEHDNTVDPRKDDSISVSEDDLRDAKAGKRSGRDVGSE